MNKVILTGKIGSIKNTPRGDGTALRIALKSWFRKDGRTEYKTTWVTVRFFGPQATNLQQMASVGEPIAIEARLENWNYEGKELTLIKGISFELMGRARKKKEDIPAEPEEYSLHSLEQEEY